MINKFDELISKLHDARLFGFLLDHDPNTMDLNLILYVQIFSDYNFELELYSLEKTFIIFEKTSINKLSINNDLFSGQFFITDIVVEQLEDKKFKYNFFFNVTSIELILISENVHLISSGIIKENNIQFLPTNWKSLLD
ncbi:hypothetical protein [Acinetobacter silvestris]|uniref:Uncharacterized protein n=1 Tax=Acinetobacter silvestris TaxID=1977882 RepID=A0A1Y3CHS6_9GAMM|nr:hypothetical protein [Acinetobacter silvestris]OTG66667.1 hypothetical protein B9T28_05325 [Acinetobacter silvestris]